MLIHEDPHYLILNKPAGLIVHNDGRREESSVVGWVLQEYPDIDGVGEDWINDEGMTIKRPGIVHRLDRQTSGVMIVARTAEMFDHLKSQFKDHQVRKVYKAFTYGWLKDDEGSIRASIGKSRSDFRRWSAQRGARGQLREARTDYRVNQRFEHQGERFSSMTFKPKTGRTHQIRVHAKYMSTPIVADSLYAGKLLSRPNLGFDRQALHAHHITFTDLSGAEQSYSAPLPDDFKAAEALIG